MPKLPIKIEFDAKDKKYQAGERVTGQIKLSNPDGCQITQIQLKIKGQSYCSWAEQRVKEVKSKYNIYMEEFVNLKNHFRHSETLYDSQSKSKKVVIKLHNIFKFHYDLPHRLPSTFEGLHGHTVYFVAIKVFIGDKKVAVREPFTVIEKVDLNSIEASQHPFLLKVNNYVGVWIFKSGPIRAKIKTRKSGFLAGEVAPFVIDVQNNSSRNIGAVELGIIQVITYSSETPEKHATIEENVIKFIDFKGVTAKENRLINAAFQIPYLIPTSKNHVIDIDYKMELVLNIRWCVSEIIASQPIYIGTIPLRDLSPTNSQASSNLEKDPDHKCKHVKVTSVAVLLN